MLGMNSAGEAYPLECHLVSSKVLAVRYWQFLKSLSNRIIFLLLKSTGRDLSNHLPWVPQDPRVKVSSALTLQKEEAAGAWAGRRSPLVLLARFHHGFQ